MKQLIAGLMIFSIYKNDPSLSTLSKVDGEYLSVFIAYSVSPDHAKALESLGWIKQSEQRWCINLSI